MRKIFTLLCLVLCARNTFSQSLNVGLSTVVTDLSFPLGVENCGDSRLFIVQKGGQIIVTDSVGNKYTSPYLDISDRVNATAAEGGLLGLAFDPRYKNNGYFYVDYLNRNGNIQISRFRVNPNNLDVANIKSERLILEIPLQYQNHMGGCIRFGPDGNLYIAVGDGDALAAGDPLNNSQNPRLLLGKLLRIKIPGTGTYVIPKNNPFIDSANYRKEIWAMGLRNPWRFSFDAFTGALFIGDVGEALWEEVDMQNARSKGGENYGWRCYEGNHEYNTSNCLPPANYKFPLFEYTHATHPSANDCAITGGFVYRGSEFPNLYGKYFYTDFCSGIIRALTFTKNTASSQDVYSGALYAYTSFGEDYKHELYVVNSAGNSVSKIVSNVNIAKPVENTVSMSVYPNPSAGTFSVKINTSKAEECLVSVYGSNSKQVYVAKRVSVAGNNVWNVMLPSTVKGNCYVMISTMSGAITRENILIK